MAIVKPIKDAIICLEAQTASLADCFFGLAQLGAAIKNISDSDHHCIQVFNSHFQEFDFDEHLLAYYLHPRYRGK